MHFKDLAKLFNIGNFFVYCCLLVFSVLLSLRVDDIITWNYAVVFLPIWVWNIVLVVAVSMGIGFWVKKKNRRYGNEDKRHLIAMLQTFFLHIPLFLTELLVVINIESGGSHSWTAIFTPAYILTILSVGSCVLSCCFKRCNIEFEILSMASLLQLLIVGLRLDDVTSWTWAIVLIPTWISLILLVVGVVIYSVLKCCLLVIEEDQQVAKLRKPLTLVLLICLSLSTGLIILFMALLSARLDGLISAQFTVLFIPLHIIILILLITTATRDPANPWWLGLGKNFAEFILDALPFVQEYANISHQSDYNDNVGELELTDIEPAVSHYDNLLAVDDPVRVRNRTRPFLSSSKKTSPVENVGFIDSNVYPFENLYEPD